MINIQIEIAENAAPHERVLRIRGKNIEAEYYHDGSGEVFITDNDHEKMIFEADDARIKHHLKYLEKKIAELRKHADIAEKCLLVLKDAKKRAKL